MTDDTRLRVGLVGAGPWARRVHAPGIAAHPDTELVAVWARRPAAAAEVATANGATPVDSFDDLLSTVDAVAFAVPPAVQAPLAARALRAGKHAILEKPVAPDTAAARELVDAAEAGNATTLIVLTFRYATNTAAWLEEVHRVGGWRGGAARWLSGTLLDVRYADSAWRHAGGALADIGPHVFDMLDAALGPITDVLTVHRTEPDLWQIVFGHDGGRLSTATLSMHTPVTPSITDFSVFGEHGYHEFDATGSANERYAALLSDFTGLVVAGRTTHPCDVRRGLHLQQLIDEVTRKGTPAG